MTTLDRMFLVNYIRSYIIVLTSLLSLYIIVDLFTHLDDFSGRGFRGMLLHIGRYYGTQIALIFDRLSDAITLTAAMFTVAWMQRNNELLPQLSAGISTTRVIRPILLGCALTLALAPLNQEFFIPNVADNLQAQRSDLDRERPAIVNGAYDSTGVHLDGVAAYYQDKKVKGMYITFPESTRAGLVHVSAQEAVYVPKGSGPRSGGWLLYQTEPVEFPAELPPYLDRVTVGQFFLKTNEVDFDAVTRGPNWFLYAPFYELQRLLAKADPRRQPAVAVAFHMRLTRPLIGIILVLMGLGVILRDQNRHVFINAGMCLALCAVFYVAVLGSKYLGEHDFVSPALAAWLPVLVFGPIAVTLFDAMHT